MAGIAQNQGALNWLIKLDANSVTGLLGRPPTSARPDESKSFLNRIHFVENSDRPGIGKPSRYQFRRHLTNQRVLPGFF